MAAGARSLDTIIDARYSRRGFLAGMSATAVAASMGCATTNGSTATRSTVTGATSRTAPLSGFVFPEIARGTDQTHLIPEGYEADIILRWGDALFPEAPAFDPYQQTASAQERQFGYNNDFIGFYPLPESSEGLQRGLLCVNHEYTSTQLMFPDLKGRSVSQSECEVELAGHGGTVVEIELDRSGHWHPVLKSRYNRRITAGSTSMTLTGPAAGSDRLKTADDPTGRHVIGTMNNCAGGITPWGTYMMSEENFNGNFLGALADGHPEACLLYTSPSPRDS